MYSCTSLGTKLGGGLGTAVSGWLLEISGFSGTLAVQPDSCIRMLHFMYLWLPFLLNILILFILSKMKVEETNEKIKKEMAVSAPYACRGCGDDGFMIKKGQ